MKGIPKIVQQMDVSNENLALQVKGSIKVAVLKGDPSITDLMAISYYDSKPVYFLSSVISNVQWIVKEKKESDKSISMFLVIVYYFGVLLQFLIHDVIPQYLFRTL